MGRIYGGTLIAHAAFWVILIYGWSSGEIGAKGAMIFLILWTAGLFALPLIFSGVPLLTPFVAILDIALVLMVFKGDVRLG